METLQVQHRQRQRVFSFSSTETILEKYSSSSPTSAGSSEHHVISLSRRPHRPRSGNLPKRIDEVENTQIGDNEQQEVSLAVEEEEEEEEEGDSDESINWDESSSEEDEETPEPKARATFPQTIGFWFDLWIGTVAFASTNVELQVLCLRLQLWREKYEIDYSPMYQVRPGRPAPAEESMHSLPTPTEPKSTFDFKVLSDNLGGQLLEWDKLLQEMKLKARDMHQTRKWRADGRRNVAGWCRWGAKGLSKKRGEFVAESQLGYEVERQVNGEKWFIQLGYRRDDAVLGDMDLDDEDDASAETAGEDVAAHTRRLGLEDDNRTQEVSLPRNGDIDGDLTMANAGAS